ncbi:hypothetical protein EON64_06030 [archaeon]|nr:MAG: hypothetical protein EON64_06030 [archaeon]
MSAPDYKPNASIDGTTVNGHQGNSSGRAGKSSSPADSEELNRYVTDDTPRVKREPAPLPGVMVCPLPPFARRY